MSRGRARGVVFATLVGALAAPGSSRSARADAPLKHSRDMTATGDARACAPTRSGSVAVATGGGLVLVAKDGTSRVLTSRDGLPETRVHAVVLGRDENTVWVGTEAGAALVDVSHISRARVVRAIAGDAVHAVAVGRDGVYLGTWSPGPTGRVPASPGVLHVPDAAAPPVPLRFAPHVSPSRAARGARVAALAEHEGALWIAYADGPLARLGPDGVAPVVPTPARTVHGQALSSVATPEGRRLVLGALEGLFRVDVSGSGASFTTLSTVDARAIGVGAKGSLLVGTFGAGLLEGAPASALRGALHEAGAATGVSPRSVAGLGAHLDVRCAATPDGLFVDGGSGRFARRGPMGLPSNDVTAIAETPARDRVAVGTFDRGVAIVARGQHIGEERVTRELATSDTVNALAWQGEGAREVLWVGTARGLLRIATGGGKAPETLRRYTTDDGLPDPTVRAIAVLTSGSILVGTDRGAATLDVEAGRIAPIVPKSGVSDRDPSKALASPRHATWAVAEGEGGVVYLGTTTGLYWGRLHPTGTVGPFERASLASRELSDDWVTALASDGSDLYVGTYAKGVVRLRWGADGPLRSRPRATLLGGGYVNPAGLLVAGGSIYAATMDGLLTRARADDVAPWRAVHGAAPGRDVTASRVLSGERWTSSRRGIGVTQL